MIFIVSHVLKLRIKINTNTNTNYCAEEEEYNSAKTCLCGKTPPRLGHLAPASEVAGGLLLPGTIWPGRGDVFS
jgi:hypothetical protein